MFQSSQNRKSWVPLYRISKTVSCKNNLATVVQTGDSVNVSSFEIKRKSV